MEVARSDGLLALVRLGLLRYGLLGEASIRGWRVRGFVEYRRFLEATEAAVKAFVRGIKPRTLINAGAWPCDYCAVGLEVGVGRVLGFEPDPENYGYCVWWLRRNLVGRGYVLEEGEDWVRARGGGGEVLLYRRGLWDRPTRIGVRASGPTPGSKEAVAGGGGVVAEPLSNYESLVEEPCVAVIDVEGNELRVLEGARSLWDRCLWVIEVQPGNRERYREWAGRNGFGVRVLSDEGWAEYWLLTRRG